jgi:hypothetical protein
MRQADLVHLALHPGASLQQQDQPQMLLVNSLALAQVSVLIICNLHFSYFRKIAGTSKQTIFSSTANFCGYSSDSKWRCSRFHEHSKC